jgi:hypothetical protein
MSDTGLKELGSAEDVMCRDEECGGIAEVEVDGEHRYYVCEDCGFEFGYERVQMPTIGTGDNCAIQVPESIRRAASQGMDSALAAEASKAPVPLTLGMPKK